MSIRLAASVAAAALLCACTAPKSGSGTAAASPSASPGSLATSAGPPNAPVPRAGQRPAIPLDADQRRELESTVGQVPPAIRPRLRYALATGDDGKPHLVVYDGEGLGVSGRHPGRPHEYIVFRVINAKNGEHYDPLQNAIIAPIPPPPQREVQTKP
ncbi:MAG TPA: hypothetical protein VGX96_03755 [Candidatus Elarobacter sp.]|jgi:hypothetical protein|nr:hypothetical protein [Candidatus Elarobacter sp.]